MKGLKLIGKGAFTKCYQLSEDKVLLKTEDPIKECMAHGWFPDSELFPEVSHSDVEGCYEMKYYPKVRSLKNNLSPDQYRLYKELRLIFSEFRQPVNPYDRYNAWHDAFECSDLDQDIKETMQYALLACGNYGTDVCFEISPRNVAVDDGKVVLLNCFFMESKLKEVNKR